MTKLHSQHVRNSHCLNVVPWVRSIVLGYILFLTAGWYWALLFMSQCIMEEYEQALWAQMFDWAWSISVLCCCANRSLTWKSIWTRVTCGLIHDMGIIEIVHVVNHWDSNKSTPGMIVCTTLQRDVGDEESWAVASALWFYSHSTRKNYRGG